MKPSRSPVLCPPDVQQVIDRRPSEGRQHLFTLRGLIFTVATETPGVGPLEETLRWGDPSYITTQSRSGSLIRINGNAREPLSCAMLFHCQTSLVDTFRTLFPTGLRFVGNRAIVLLVRNPLPIETLAFCIEAALAYRLRHKQL